MKPRGVSRDAENERALILYFDRRPTDNELREIHDGAISREQVIAWLEAEAEWVGPESYVHDRLLDTVRLLKSAIQHEGRA